MADLFLIEIDQGFQILQTINWTIIYSKLFQV